MENTFSYNSMVLYANELEVESVGNIILKGVDDAKNLEHILVIYTELGITRIIEIHGYDKDMLSSNFTLKYNRMGYDDYKLEKVIDKFLNNSRIRFNNLEIITLQTFLDNYNDIDLEELIRR